MAVEPEGSGTATDETDESPYTEGTEVDIFAEANQGWAFVNWTSDAGVTFVDASDPDTTFTMPSNDVTVTANFALIDYEVSLSVDPENSGTVSGDDTYNFGDPVTIVATPEAGYKFVNWTNDDDGDAVVSTDASYPFTMPAGDVNYTANFIVCFTPDVEAQVNGDAITEIIPPSDPLEGFEAVFTITNSGTETDTQDWRWWYEWFDDEGNSLGLTSSSVLSVELEPGESDTITYTVNQDRTVDWNVGYYFILTTTSLCDNEVAEWTVEVVGVNINTADFDTLQLIIHIGPVRAQEIIDLREVEPFSSLDDLDRVHGIAAGRIQDIKDQGIAYVDLD